MSASVALFVGIAIRALTHDAIPSYTLAALALPLWAVWASRRGVYMPLAALPIAATVALWTGLDLSSPVGPSLHREHAVFHDLVGGVPAVLAFYGLGLLGSFVTSLWDETKPSPGDRAIRVLAWLSVLAALSLLVARRSLWNRPTLQEYLRARTVTATLPPLSADQPQSHAIGRVNVLRRVIQGYCPISFGFDEPAPAPKFVYYWDYDDSGRPPRVDTDVLMPCGEVTLRIDQADDLLFVETPTTPAQLREFKQRDWSDGFSAKRFAGVTGPPPVTFVPPLLGVALALFALLRRPARPGGARSRLVEGEFDDEVGKLYLEGEADPIPWRDAQVPGGRVVAVMAPVKSAGTGSYRSAGTDSRVLSLLPGRLADFGQEDRRRWACLALAVAVAAAAPFAVVATWYL